MLLQTYYSSFLGSVEMTKTLGFEVDVEVVVMGLIVGEIPVIGGSKPCEMIASSFWLLNLTFLCYMTLYLRLALFDKYWTTFAYIVEFYANPSSFLRSLYNYCLSLAGLNSVLATISSFSFLSYFCIYGETEFLC